MAALTSSLVPAQGLGFSQAVSTAPASAPCTAASRSAPSSLQVVSATGRQGTQLFRWPGQKEPKEPQGKGTIIIRKGQSQGDGTKIKKVVKPEEVAAAPAGFFDNLTKLPFANLFRGGKADPKTVFVAGATGQTGTRVVLELLAAGFTVRAGVDEAQSAESLSDLAAQYRRVISADDAKRLNFVQCSLEDPEFTAKSISNAGKLVVALGSSENGPKASLSAQQALVLLEAAQVAKTPYYVLVTDLADIEGSSGGGIFGAVFGFLAGLGKKAVSYQDLLREIIDSDIQFSIIRAGKTAPDTTAASTNIVITPEGKLTSGSVSRAQVAQVVAELLTDVSLAENKIFDVIARNDVEARPVAELLASVPVDGRRSASEAARAKAEAEAKEREFREASEAEARAVAAEAKAAAESLAALEAEAKKVAAEEAKIVAVEAKLQAKAQAAAASVGDLAKSLKEASGGAKSVIPSFASLVPDIPPPTPSSVAAAAQAAFGAPKAKGTVSGTTDSKSRRPLRQRPARTPPKVEETPKAPVKDQKTEKNKIFGGLLGEQETIYVDEDY